MRLRRRAILGTAAAALAAIGIGVGVYIPSGGGGSGASYYIATSGSDSNPGTSVSPFLTMDKCYTVASVGDTCYMKTGTFGTQTISSSTKTSGACDGYTIGASLTGCVTFQPDTGATVSISGSLEVRVSYIQVKDLTVGASHIGDCGSASNITNVVASNLSAASGNVVNANHVGVLGGSYGPLHGNQLIFVSNGIYDNCSGAGAGSSADHIRFDGVYFHDAIQDSVGQHLECLHTEPADYVTVRYSKFTNCAQHDITFGGGGVGRGFLVENNLLASVCSGQSSPPCEGNNPIDSSCNGGDHSGWIVRFNSMVGAMQNSLNTGCTYTDGQFYGNVMDASWWSSFQCSNFQNYGFTQSYNVNVSGAPTCGTGSVTGTVMTSPGNPNYNFNPLAGNPGINLVPNSLAHPSTDYNGYSRGSGSTDAGAIVYH